MFNSPSIEGRGRFTLHAIALLSLIFLIPPVGSAARLQDQDGALLEVSKTFPRELAPEQKHIYKIAIAATQYVTIRVEQQGLDVALVLLAPNGEQLIEVDSPNGREGPEQIEAALADAGLYTLEVRALEKGAPTGRYTVTLTEVRNATDED